MDFIKDKHIDSILFLTLKKGAILTTGELKHVLEESVEVPLLIEDFMKDIQQIDKADVLKVGHLLKGMVFLIGLDSGFKYNQIYQKILSALTTNIEAYIIQLINNQSEFVEIEVVFSKALVAQNRSARNLFIFADSLERLSVDYASKNMGEKSRLLFQKAIDLYHESISMDNQFSLPYYKLGFYYKNIGRYITSKDFWETFLSLDQDEMRKQEIREEMEKLEKLVDYEIGSNAILKGRSREGLDKLLPLVNLNPNWWNLLFLIGLGFRQIEEFQIAADYFRNVIKLKPDQSGAMNELALCYMSLSRFEDAITYLDAALALDQNSEILSNRAVAHHYLGNKEKALKDIELALKINPDDEVANMIKEVVGI